MAGPQVIRSVETVSFSLELKHSQLPAKRLGMNSRKALLGIFCCCLIMQLSGCTSIPTQPQTDAVATTVLYDPATATQAVLAREFNILGRLAIQDEKQSFSGSFRWVHLAASDEILLFTPLGQAVAEITKDDGGVRLITSKMEGYYANDAETLTEQILGWRLPLDGLRYWIQGMHSPLSAAEKDLDRQNQVLAIRQDGWHIHYNNFIQTSLSPAPLPKNMNLFYENQNLKIRVIVDNWKVE